MQRIKCKKYKTAWMALIVTVVMTLSGCEKARLDEEVQRLCAMDGGIRVYEKVDLPAEKFDKYGTVVIAEISSSKSGDEYYFRHTTNYLVRGNPEMWRDHFQVIRRVDNKVLGESVSYSRRGGDFPGPWQSSSFGCPSETDISSLKKKIFVPTGVDKK